MGPAGDPELTGWGEDGEAEATSVVPPFSEGAFFGDRFRIERLLGTGGMGNVYEATDLQRKHRVALKVLSESRGAEAETRERFRREAEILSSMDHPGIVRIHDVGHAPQGTPWIAMELLAGETLADRVRRQGPQDPDSLLRIARATADALEAMHARGVVHRDLKPDNVFLPAGAEYPVRLLDFGLSRATDSKKLTKTGAVIGTPRYMAPEQIRSAHRSDKRVDVYALGVILYEALAGRSPFTASDHGQLLGAILSGNTSPLSAVRPELPGELSAVLAWAMAPDPEQRIATPEELVERFAAALGRPSSYPALPPARASSRRRGLWVALALGAAVGLAAAGAGLALYLGGW